MENIQTPAESFDSVVMSLNVITVWLRTMSDRVWGGTQIGGLTILLVLAVALVAMSMVVIYLIVGGFFSFLFLLLVLVNFTHGSASFAYALAATPLLVFLVCRAISNQRGRFISWSIEDHVREQVHRDHFSDCPDTAQECFDEGVEIPEWAADTVVVTEEVRYGMENRGIPDGAKPEPIIKAVEAINKINKRRLRAVRPTKVGAALSWLVTEGKILFPNARLTPEMLIAVRLKLASLLRDPTNGLNVRNKDVLMLSMRAATLVLIPTHEEIFEARMLKSFTATQARDMVDLAEPSWWIKLVRFVQGHDFARAQRSRGGQPLFQSA